MGFNLVFKGLTPRSHLNPSLLIQIKCPNVTLSLTDFFVDWSSVEELNLLQGGNKNMEYITKTRKINVVFRKQRHFLDIMQFSDNTN